ncbi:MAG: LysR family transcriptional regulator [Rhodanobacter sp.]|nr:MAG: LysR family transcriptional regulator [Rhodanobacter sp.]TAM40213.1 MAG: LysR family transcriptional regulator [Rhodanobacter sp.]
MSRSDVNNVLTFVAVARKRSSTKVAAKLSVFQSAPSHILRGLETRIDVRLLNRTTRSVADWRAQLD